MDVVLQYEVHREAVDPPVGGAVLLGNR